ncbi:GNAT family N-acetyltransferase [Actinokineospora diospyrosa]|uniref:GNAT family N-acetyltransferase n=1 Tax=Actinokineospora diospyrosa TaxID=103728 RepID=UPI0020A5F4C3|nr:GNAT family N-acetyltransferase [Actinokineospora diospyrosa]
MERLTVRPIAGRAELGLFNRVPYVLNGELEDDLVAGRRRPEWMWIALRGEDLVARVAWWGRAGAPFLLDIFDADCRDIGERLLRIAMAAVVPSGGPVPEYIRTVAPDWRSHETTRRAVEDRMAALERTGARLLVERLRFEWRAGTPVPEPAGRLRFRPVRDIEEILGLMTRVLAGTLDAHGRDDLTRMSAREAAVKHYEEELAHFRSPREWWRIATLPSGEPVGFTTPARNDYNPVTGYLAVVPEHRGNGYIDEILAEGTRVLRAQGATRIRAATDLGNTPMANAFRRAGYVNIERTINMVWR